MEPDKKLSYRVPKRIKPKTSNSIRVKTRCCRFSNDKVSLLFTSEIL